MSTNQNLYGTNLNATQLIVAPVSVLDIEIKNPNDLTAFSDFHILDVDGVVVGHNSIKSYCAASGGARTYKLSTDGTYFIYGHRMNDIYNHVTSVKQLLQAYGYILGGVDFANPDPLAFWVLEADLIKELVNTHPSFTIPIVEGV